MQTRKTKEKYIKHRLLDYFWVLRADVQWAPFDAHICVLATVKYGLKYIRLHWKWQNKKKKKERETYGDNTVSPVVISSSVRWFWWKRPTSETKKKKPNISTQKWFVQMFQCHLLHFGIFHFASSLFFFRLMRLGFFLSSLFFFPFTLIMYPHAELKVKHQLLAECKLQIIIRMSEWFCLQYECMSHLI